MTTRRGFIGGLAAMAAVVTAGRFAKGETPRLGHGPEYFDATMGYRVPKGKRFYVNGEDWTNRGIRCHIGEGWVEASDVDENGKKIIACDFVNYPEGIVVSSKSIHRGVTCRIA